MAKCILPESVYDDNGDLNLTNLFHNPSARYTFEELMTLFTTEERKILIGVFSVIIIIGLVANVCVIISIVRRKNRYIQKALIISLTVADLLTLISMGINNLESFSHSMIDWRLGDFMCSAIPVLQVYGILASSFSLLMIAMDRYRNVVHALNKQWNPTLRSCIIGAVILWVSCGAISYPMSTYFFFASANVISQGDDGKIKCGLYYMCISLQKQNLIKYHLSLTCIIFLPVLIAFIWFYYKIALLIWRHRKPVSPNGKESENENSMTKSTDVVVRNDQENGVSQGNVPKKRNLHVERKIRTLKIIITLLLVFIVCRLPYWIYFALKNYFASLGGHWIINYAMIALSLLNCALNPFLYTFLRPTINNLSKILKHINQFLCQVCCCCFSDDDLDEFDRDDKYAGINVRKKPTVRIVHGRYISNSNNENSENSGGNNNNNVCEKY